MNDGTMLDLASRGKKDAYFIQDPRRTWFGTSYDQRSPSSREVRRVYTEAPPQFGTWTDIELPRYGDVLVNVDIRIQMPTWLPPEVAALNRAGHLVQVESQTPGRFLQYGWTNSIANYLVHRWAIFADSYMLTEGWGEFNAWYPDMETDQMHAPAIHAATGTHDGSDLKVQLNGTPPELVFRLPLFGCQYQGDVGLPLCAIPGQRLYLRLWLADKSKLVESSVYNTLFGQLPEYELCPSPWGSRRIKVDSVLVDAVTKTATEMGNPYIYGSYTVLHLEEEMRATLRSRPLEVLFRQQRREDWTIPAALWHRGAALRHRLEIHGFFQALFLGIISTARRLQNKYTDISPPGNGEWLTNLALDVNGFERIQYWPPKKFRDLAQNTQLHRDVSVSLYNLIFGVNPEEEPAGPCNLSRTQKVQLLMDTAIIPTDPTIADRTAFAFLFGMSWNVLDIRDGTCMVRFPD